jgi:tyrosinase
VAAVQTLRHPYWDWAVDPTLPPAVSAVNVTVRAPCGVVEIPNPLSGYRFKRPSVESSFGGFLATRPQTIRCIGEGGTLSNITASNENLLSAAEDLTSDVVCLPSRNRPRSSM